MLPESLNNRKLWDFLLRVDEFEAERVREEGCRHCGGVLHLRGYVRKPRGIEYLRGSKHAEPARARQSRSMPMLRCAGSLRFMIAPPPKNGSIHTSCGGCKARIAWHSPEVAFDPNHAAIPRAVSEPQPDATSTERQIYVANTSFRQPTMACPKFRRLPTDTQLAAQPASTTIKQTKVNERSEQLSHGNDQNPRPNRASGWLRG